MKRKEKYWKEKYWKEKYWKEKKKGKARYEKEVLEKRLTAIVPEERQIRHQQMEFYAFVHFTVNTYTDKEWGDGTESETMVNPTQFDADQWVEAVKSAGMKALILTCKHHDGFCLRPSRYTDHTIAKSPYRNGQGIW